MHLPVPSLFLHQTLDGRPYLNHRSQRCLMRDTSTITWWNLYMVPLLTILVMMTPPLTLILTLQSHCAGVKS
ncbi:hypothetical protein LSH36_683g03097, partial [Paralvinella palmiformis]